MLKNTARQLQDVPNGTRNVERGYLQKVTNCLCYYDVDADTGNKYRTAVNYEVLA